ncbi:AraC family transcriptional regulator [Paenibacillus oryzisoli]|uniref:AraC family transcriptional regulator n=1 Tax=Paenibacillus oryzisoli TaxID=1850517 RepID=UPI003D2AD795
MSFMNIPYRVDVPQESVCRFVSIWHVHADPSYTVNKKNGFDDPGIFITISGTGTFLQGGNLNTLEPGTLFFVEAGSPAVYACHAAEWKFYYLDFSSLDMVRQLGLPIHTVVPIAKMPETEYLCRKLTETLIARPLGHMYASSLILQELLLLFARTYAQPEASSGHQELTDVLMYIHSHFHTSLTVDELVRLSQLSRTVFFKRFRAVTGQAPSDYILTLKLNSAQLSLETTRHPIKEIAANLSFYDEFHFSKLFKRKFGLSPKAYRELKER